jgi:hypothetical protein
VVGAEKNSDYKCFTKNRIRAISFHSRSLTSAFLRNAGPREERTGKFGFQGFAHNLRRELRTGEFFLFFSPVTH